MAGMGQRQTTERFIGAAVLPLIADISGPTKLAIAKLAGFAALTTPATRWMCP
jgi:hypothetical protein